VWLGGRVVFWMVLCAYVCVERVCVCVEKIDGVVCIVLGDGVPTMLF